MGKDDRISQNDKSRADRYHDEFAEWMLLFYTADDANREVRLKFIEDNKEEFPKLEHPHMSFRVTSRLYFDKYIYSLREETYNRESLPKHNPGGWL